MDQFANDDSTSNQSDSSSSSANVISRQKQVLYGNTSSVVRSTGVHSIQHETSMSRDESEQANKTSASTTKRALITKNTGISEKRKRNVSDSGIAVKKREPKIELNDEVRFLFLFEKLIFCLFRKIQKILALDVVVGLLTRLVNVMDQVVS